MGSCSFLKKKLINFWLCWVFVVAHGLSSFGSRALVHLTSGGKWMLMTKWEERGACVVVVQMPGCAWVFATPWTAACLVSPVFPYFPEFAQTHVHCVADAIQPSHPLSSPSPSTSNHSQHQSIFWLSQFFTSGGQTVGVSASTSVLPMNTQDWYPLG